MHGPVAKLTGHNALQGGALPILATVMHNRHAVTEFVNLHDIPYIFLSPDSQPYLSIDKFLASPDRYQNLSGFIPNASFP